MRVTELIVNQLPPARSRICPNVAVKEFIPKCSMGRVAEKSSADWVGRLSACAYFAVPKVARGVTRGLRARSPLCAGRVLVLSDVTVWPEHATLSKE